MERNPGSVVPHFDAENDIRLWRRQVSPSVHQWRADAVVTTMDVGVAYECARIGAGAGPLQHLDQRTHIASVRATAIMLSLSGGVLSPDPEGLLLRTTTSLLEIANVGERQPGEVVSSLRQRLSQVFEGGGFCGGVPNGVVVSASRAGQFVAARFGPVGIATVNDDRVTVLHTDDRFPALRRIVGPELEKAVGAAALSDVLLSSVSSLTQLDPADESQIVTGQIPTDGTIMLMSRGALPLVFDNTPTPLNEWARLDAGWHHGMAGTVVQIFREEWRSRHAPFSWLHGG